MPALLSGSRERVIISLVSRRVSSPILIGRAIELGELASAFDRASNGSPELVLIAGEAGAGKSRLVAEFVDGAARGDARILQGSCLDLHGDGLAYAPFVEAFRTWLRRADPADATIIADHAEAIAALLPDMGRRARRGSSAKGRRVEASPDVRLVRLLDAVLAVLGQSAKMRPIILVLEDIHWADASTRDLLRFLVRNLRDEALLLLATYRTDELHRRHPVSPLLTELLRADRVSRIDLPPLDRQAVRDLVEAILDEPVDAEVVDLLAERSDGLPFYLEELVAAGPGRTGMPATLRDILGRRLGGLPPVARTLLGAAAVIGRQTPEAALAAVSGLAEDDLILGLRATTEAGILVVDVDLAGPMDGFRHALLREAADDQLVPPERARLHARAADHQEAAVGATIGGATVAAELAGHAFAAHDQPRALLWSVRATRSLVAAAAFQEALVHAERALTLWPQVADPELVVDMDLLEVLELAASAANGGNRQERAVVHLQAALAEVDRRGDIDPEREASLLIELWSSAWEAYDFDVAGPAIHRAADLMDRLPPQERLMVSMVLGNDRWWSGRLRESARVLEEAVAMAETTEDAADWGEAMTYLAHTRADLGQAEIASATIDRSAAASRSGGRRYRQVMCWGDRSVTLLTVGRFADGEAAALEGLEVARRYGWEERVNHYLRACLVDACFELGRLDEVDAIAAPVLAGAGVAHSIEWMRLSVARVEVRRGNLDAARLLLAGIDSADDWGAGNYVTLTATDLARAAGDFEEVRRLVDQVAAEVGEEAVMPGWQILGLGIEAASDAAGAARLRRRPGQVEMALEAATAWMDVFRRIVARARMEGGAGPWAEATLATAEAELDRMQGSADPDRWATIVSGWDALPHPFSAAAARLRLADALLRTGDRGGARDALLPAAASASAMGASPLHAAIVSLAASVRIPLDDIDASDRGMMVDDSPLAILTPREQAVLRLVARGHTNREVGAQLFISEKTVSVHVSNAMAKLGALSRYEAAAAAERQGLF